MTDEKKYRSAITGDYVTKEYALANPDTTTAEVDTTEQFTAESAIAMVNNHLKSLGFLSRDADGCDYQAGTDSTLRFKSGASMGEVTVQVVRTGVPTVPLRAHSWGGTDRLMIDISGIVDEHQQAPGGRR